MSSVRLTPRGEALWAVLYWTLRVFLALGVLWLLVAVLSALLGVQDVPG